jgi:hypothetical protein
LLGGDQNIHAGSLAARLMVREGPVAVGLSA